jgi:CheY-like chemotaxis protein
VESSLLVHEQRTALADVTLRWEDHNIDPALGAVPSAETGRLAPQLLNSGRVLMNFQPQPDELGRPCHTLELKAILLVDDDQQLASALQWILADENFLVDVAFDGEEAILKVKAHQYDAVICDLKMPRVHGDEFYLKAKKLRPSLADRFIFITGFAADPKIALFFNKHEVKYLVKPFPIEVLISCVKQLFSEIS